MRAMTTTKSLTKNYNDSNKISAYANASQTMSQVQQIISLYDAILKALYKGKQAMNQNNPAERYNNIKKASDIVIVLRDSLDFEKGGEIAKTLHEYYQSINFSLFKLLGENNIKLCEKIDADLRAMRASWCEIEKNQFQPRESSDNSSSSNNSEYNSSSGSTQHNQSNKYNDTVNMSI